jgi:hypothetical protein
MFDVYALDNNGRCRFADVIGRLRDGSLMKAYTGYQDVNYFLVGMMMV